MNKKNVVIHKTAAVLQLIATGALSAIAADPGLVPPQYRVAAIVAVGALQALMPSPVKKADSDTKQAQ